MQLAQQRKCLPYISISGFLQKKRPEEVLKYRIPSGLFFLAKNRTQSFLTPANGFPRYGHPLDIHEDLRKNRGQSLR